MDELRNLNNRELLIRVATLVEALDIKIEDHEKRIRTQEVTVADLQRDALNREKGENRRLAFLAILATLGAGLVDIMMHLFFKH